MKRSPLTRKTPLKKTSSIKRKHRAVPTDIYQQVLLRDKGCVARSAVPDVQCRGRIDPHHKILKSQGGPDTPDNLICLCRSHHSWVHQHPEQSHNLGFLRHAWDA